MPTYEYECEACGHAFERFQRMKDEPIRNCPECGGSVRRLISTGGGLLFKGPGFYATDYRSGSSRAGGAGEDGKGKKSQESPKGGDGEAGKKEADGD